MKYTFFRRCPMSNNQLEQKRKEATDELLMAPIRDGDNQEDPGEPAPEIYEQPSLFAQQQSKASAQS
ncbi:MAG: hypothetical protein V1763_01845 [Parcubacteria group bacterium]